MKIAFMFIVKDGGRYLQKNLNIIKSFNQDIYAVENNSKDNTKTILSNANLKSVLNLDLGDDKFSTKLCKTTHNCIRRIRRLAYLRQKVLDSVMNSGITYDYVCMLDMDFVHVELNHLRNMFEYMRNHKDIDGMFGMSTVKYYFTSPYDIGSVKPVYKIPTITLKLHKYVQVESAFSGFGIYRYSSILNKSAKYDSKHIKDIEHIYFNSHFDKLIVDTEFNPLYNVCKKSIRHFTYKTLPLIVSLLIVIIYIVYKSYFC